VISFAVVFGYVSSLVSLLSVARAWVLQLNCSPSLLIGCKFHGVLDISANYYFVTFDGFYLFNFVIIHIYYGCCVVLMMSKMLKIEGFGFFRNRGW